jgi:hypothetical protein
VECATGAARGRDLESRRIVIVHYIACSTSSAVDAKTNRLSLFHVLDEISAPGFPLTLATICVASLFEREVEEDPLQIYNLAFSLNSALLASFPMQVEFHKARRNRAVNTIAGLSIPAPGMVLVSIVQKNRVLAQWPMPAIQTGGVSVGVSPSSTPPRNEKPPTPAKTRPTVN